MGSEMCIRDRLRSIRSPHEIQVQLESIHAHFVPTQSRAICSHDLPRLSRSPLIRSHDGSAAAAAAHKSAAPPAQGVLNPGSTSLRRASAKLNGRAAALAGPLCFHSLSTQLFASILCILQFRASEVLRIRILDASGPRSSKHYVNLCSLGAQNS